MVHLRAWRQTSKKKEKKNSTQQNTPKPNCAIKTPLASLLLYLSCLHFTALIIKPLKRKLCRKWQSHANLKTQIQSVCRVTNVCNVWRFSAMRFKLFCIVLCNLVTRVLLTVWFTFKAQLELEQRRGTSTECVSHTVHTAATGKLSFFNSQVILSPDIIWNSDAGSFTRHHCGFVCLFLQWNKPLFSKRSPLWICHEIWAQSPSSVKHSALCCGCTLVTCWCQRGNLNDTLTILLFQWHFIGG